MFDSDEIPLVTRLEAGSNVNVAFAVNSEGEGVYTITSNTDSEVVKNMVLEHAGAATAVLRADLDSETTRIQTLLVRAETAVSRLDSDESNIQSIRDEMRDRLDSDSAVIQHLALNAGHDSDSIVNMIEEHAAASSSGNGIQLGTPIQDGSLTNETGLIKLESTETITDAIDRLNEASRNILNNTAVANLSFVGDTIVGGAGFTTTLTTSADGTPNRYDINWGDGTVDSDSTDSTPSHTYSSNNGSPFTVRVTARNNSGTGAGSFSASTRTNYVIVYTATPAPSFAIYAASTGGSPITNWDDGATIYLQNNTTNTSNSIASYSWNFGDSDGSIIVVDSDAQQGGAVGNSGTRLPYTFELATEVDRTFNVSLTLNSHTTANPADIPAADSDNFYKVYDTHTPSVSVNDSDGINEEATSGHVITVTNNSSAGVGSNAAYSNTYIYVWGDGTSNTSVNTSSGVAGDRGTSNLTHTYTLQDSDQVNGHTVTYTGKLQINTLHSSSPFNSDEFKITIEPDLRVNYAATAVTVSDRNGDDQYSLYDFVDLTGANRALIRATNTSQHATNLNYGWGDGDSDTLTEDNSSAGSVAATIDHDYTGESAGTYISRLYATGTPGTTAQADAEARTFTIKATPSAPSNLSSLSLTLSDSTQGTSPKLSSGFTDNTSTFSTLSAGDSLNQSTARRYTSGTIDTSTINNSYNGAAGTLTASINASANGAKAFSSTSGETGTFTSLVVSQQADAHDTISSTTYPSNFYQTFDAKITKALSGYSTGLNAQRLEHSATGNTNLVHVLKDDVTAAPTINNAGTVSVNNAGTYRYISGIPYFNTGSPTINVAGIQVSNLTGQAYKDTTSVVEIDSGTNQESTSSAGTNNTNYTYANIDGASTMLSSGIPVANTGVSSAYTLATLSVPITSSSVRTVDRVQVRASNANGTGSYVENTTGINVHTSAQSGISEISIAVSNSLGAGFTDNAVRTGAFKSATTDTPALRTGTYNYYNTDIFAEDSDSGIQGTKEATIRLGILKHDITNYSTYIPPGPNRSGDTGTQYFTLAFRRSSVANFNVSITSSTGIENMHIAAPGTAIDTASNINGWLDCGIQYAGAGVPGADSGNGGNGSNGCAATGGDVIGSGALNGTFRFTLGTANSSSATGNVILVRIGLAANDTITALSVS